MRWSWRRRNGHRADEALAESREQRAAAQAQRAEVEGIADRLKRMREANHFAESVRRALEGR
jgi:hypothetical protein